MSSERLPNYLRAQRKQRGLSQAEVAFLLGCRSGAKVSRYERFLREPGLRTALALEVLFKVPVHDLFAGLSEEVERDTLRRVRTLTRRIVLRQQNPTLARKLAALSGITAPPPPDDLSYESIARQ